MSVPSCQNCGSFVTVDFARVFGNNDDEVNGCPECTSFNQLVTRNSEMPDP